MAEKMICVSVYESGINCIHRSPQGPGRSLCTMNGEMEQVLEKDCENCQMAEYNGLSRTEAVERMARALYAKYEVMCNSDDCPNDGPTCEGCPIWKKYEEMASAALDALLEVSRNE